MNIKFFKRRYFYIFCLLMCIWCVLIEPRWVAQRAFNSTLPNTKSLGLKVALTADWHLTKRSLWRVMTTERALNIVADINAAQPDIILIAGDLIAEENQIPTLASTVEDEIALIFGQLKAPRGVYAVLGNHDNWYDHEKMQKALEKQGIIALENQAQQLKNSDLWIAGIGDESTNHANVSVTFNAMPENAPALVMMHDPGSFANMPKLNALFVAGHTHGGQIYLPWVGALVVPYAAPLKWAYGWVKHNGNNMYVTSGLGVSILPLRFNMRPEWVMLNI
ncbi:MAG TPA: metallophosphoesterase [Methylophilaceae bacterium]|nr:metallophosphoesterase [Methylophilaceae bacterium]